MTAPEVPDGRDDVSPTQRRAAEVLQEAFDRLRPQGSAAWNFLANFTHLDEQFGRQGTGTQPPPQGRRARLARLRGGPVTDAESTAEFHSAMGHVIEAFRFLAARVETLEQRLEFEDHPVRGMAGLQQARDLGPWASIIVEHLMQAGSPGQVLHADCGPGQLLAALTESGATALGVEPRGTVAFGATEAGHDVTLMELSSFLPARAAASLDAVVLSGVVDRLALHALVQLLREVRRTVRQGGSVVVVAESTSDVRGQVALDVFPFEPLQDESWLYLLREVGFVEGRILDGPADDGRIAVIASVPE
jgi:Methyltransferase domain